MRSDIAIMSIARGARSASPLLARTFVASRGQGLGRSASASDALADPRRAGLGWLGSGAQPVTKIAEPLAGPPLGIGARGKADATAYAFKHKLV